MEEIIMFLPNEYAGENAKRLFADKGITIPVYTAIMEKAEALAKEKIEQGVKVIISRGRSCYHLREKLSVPVIDIRYNLSDFLSAAKQAIQVSRNVGIVGFNFRFSDSHRLRDYMEFDRFETRILSAHSETPQAVAELKAKGIEVIIGGNHTAVDEARRQGLHGVLMEFNDQSLLDAVEDARHIYKLEMEKKKQFESIATIFDLTQDGMIGIDCDQKITAMNKNAERQLGVVENMAGSVLGKFLPEALLRRVLEGESIFGDVVSLRHASVVFTGVPIKVQDTVTGAVITLQDTRKVTNMEYEIRKKMRKKGHVAKMHFSSIVGASPAIVAAKERAFQFAQVDSTVLISGDTGTGKELFAQSIHNSSNRSRHPFVAINCAALPENILESELFGYVKGAFTGARPEGKMGIFEMAHTGTIFLDEISEVSLGVQARLLRVIQEREIVRIGGEEVIPVNVRIIASTNRNLFAEVGQKRFREDLYYRLCVLNLCIPPLDRRREDIPLLARHFIHTYQSKFGKPISRIEPDAFAPLIDLPLPGNIRQLGNILECAVTLCTDGVLDGELIDQVLSMSSDQGAVRSQGMQAVLPSVPERPAAGRLSAMERAEILRVLEECGGNKTHAAKRLGIGYSTLWRKLKQMEPIS